MIKKPQLEIDDIDFKIAQELKDNARISYKLLGDKISLSVSPVYTRVKKMEENGIIKKYKTEIDWGKFGYAIHAFVLIKNEKIRDADPEFLKEAKEIINCWMISGEYDFLTEIYVANNDEFERIMKYFYKKIGKTYTLMIIRDIFSSKEAEDALS